MKQALLVMIVAALLGCDAPTGTEPDEQARQEWRGFVYDLGPFELGDNGLGLTAMPYDGSGSSGSASWTQYTPGCDQYWPSAAASCVPAPGSFQTYTGVLTGSLCLASAAASHCDPPVKAFADRAVRNAATVGIVIYSVAYVNHKWLFGGE